MRKYVSKNNAAVQTSYVGSPGELTVDPITRSVRVHDGATPGGFEISGGGAADLGNLVINDQTITGTQNRDLQLGGDTAYGHPYITLQTAENAGNVVVQVVSDNWISDYGNIPTNNVDNIFGSSAAIGADGSIYTIGGDQSLPQGIILKYDTYGNLVWQKSVNLPNSVGESIAVDSAGNIWTVFSNYSNSSINVYKLDTTGAIIGQWGIESAPKTSSGFDIIIDSNGKVLITSRTYTIENLWADVASAGSSGVVGTMLATVATFGTEIPASGGFWTMTGTGITGTATITNVTSDGTNYSLTINQSVDFDAPGGLWTITHNRNADIAILKLDPATNAIAWQWNFGNSLADNGYSITVDSLNSAIVVGSIPDPTQPLFNTTMAVVKLDTNGTVVWKKVISEAGAYVSGQGVTVDAADNIYITGIRKLSGIGNVDQLLVVKLQPDGTLLWAKTLSATNVICRGYGIAYNTSDDHLYIGGIAHGISIDSVIAKFDTNGNLKWQRLLSLANDSIDQSFLNGQKSIAVSNTHYVLTGYYYDNNANQFTAKMATSGTGLQTVRGPWLYNTGYLVLAVNSALTVTDLTTQPIATAFTASVTTNTSTDLEYSIAITYMPSAVKGLISANLFSSIIKTHDISGIDELNVGAAGNVFLQPTGNVYLGSHIIPTVDNVFDIGTPTQRVRTLYAGPNTIYIGNVKLSDVGGTFNAVSVIIDQETGEEVEVGEAGNKMGYMELTNAAINPQYLTGNVIAFTHTAYGSEVDVIDTDMSITRGEMRGIYNSAVEPSYQNYTSPANTEWNADGWGDLSDVKTRTYTTWRNAVNSNPPQSVGAELVMHDITNNKYWAIKFTEWGEDNGGSFAYTRQQIDTSFTFTKIDYGSNVDVITDSVHITRGNNQGIYNPVTETGWSQNTSPEGTLWNADGWADLSDLTDRTYTNFYAAVNGNLGNNVPGTELIMYIPAEELYCTVKFTSWTIGSNGGGFSYVRLPIDVEQTKEGIKFADDTILKSAQGLGRVKLESSGNRRIEEVYGTSEVSVTEKVTTVISAAASRSVINENLIWIDINTTTIDDIINNPATYNVWDQNSFEFSLDNSTWYKWIFSTASNGDERGYATTGNFTYNQGDTVYFRYSTGGQPVVWWNSANLPGGSSNFRGAVIDYHAYSGEATWIGTIHIVDDSGDENIAHTEVSSGSTDSENDDLWLVQNEGTISYRRTDGEAKTLKVQWSAKVFYGSEFYD